MKISAMGDDYASWQAICTLEMKIGAANNAGVVVSVAGTSVQLNDDSAVRAAVKTDLLAQKAAIVAALVAKGWEAE